ncbi:hypothetical protein HW241_04145 [Campylobacter jejuni]|nr:hypothetical protein [Campylobacter jejuni]EDP3603152.1 hypothetical protein [Campylobacter jejuni]EDP4206548.1 hypothetical protein [Campylobacter jejuni]EFP1131715.1 hypothetical protein [Campylobacter jejuni]EGI1228862.1 hypothetical protein [Campylobacter jejuni]EHJ7818141.1 hypothetical protein [Campylobacter jejuni]
MAIAIIQTAPKGITCKITAIITAIKNSRKCQELSYKLTGVGTSQNTVAIKYTAPTRDFSFYPLFIL